MVLDPRAITAGEDVMAPVLDMGDRSVNHTFQRLSKTKREGQGASLPRRELCGVGSPARKWNLGAKAYQEGNNAAHGQSCPDHQQAIFKLARFRPDPADDVGAEEAAQIADRV